MQTPYKIKNIKKVALVLMVIGYMLAGLNHFRAPDGYIHIIPSYLPFKPLLNILAGIFEIVFALMLISPKLRRFGSYGIILLLIAFLPVHIQMVLDAPMKMGDLTVTPLIAWIRLIVFQPLLIAWAWWVRR